MTTLSLRSRRKPPRSKAEQELIAGKRRRMIREALTGYLFVLPATIATFTFGLWPVVAGFYESVKSGSPITNRYVGLQNYVRQLGSLTYIILLGLSVIFLFLAYRFWRRAYERQAVPRAWLGAYVPPALLASAAFTSLAFILVTGIGGYLWFPVTMFALALGGFYTVDHMQSTPRDEWDWVEIGIGWALALGFVVVWALGPELRDALGLGIVGSALVMGALLGLLYLAAPRLGRIRTLGTASTITLMSLLMLLAILLARYTLAQMESTSDNAQEIARLIFNPDVVNGTVDIYEDDARVTDLDMEGGQVVVRVKVGGQTILAPLAPDVYTELPVQKIARLETALGEGQKVQVLLPDGTVSEGVLTGLQGQKLTVGFTTEEPRAARTVEIYSALDVGEAVVNSGGYTEPVRKQVYAVFGLLLSIAAVYTMSHVRGKLDDEENPRAYARLTYGRVVLGVVAFFMFLYLVGALKLSQQTAAGMGALSLEQFRRAYEFATGTEPHPTVRPEVLQAQLLYWPQVFSVLVGAFLIGMAYLVWRSAQKRETPLGFMLTILEASAMMIGGWLLISEIPRALALGGRETEEAMDALSRTAMYSLGTVPVQLALGIGLAYLLFSEITWGKSLYRVVYFMPYIAPSVATSTVFLVIFRLEPGSLANRVVGFFGLEPLKWLKEPEGVFRIFYAQVLGGNPISIPDVLAGPSLALATVIIYNIWVFAGYNAVVFLAGLGAIPHELYEAAEVDGANRWARFRNITLPLLSPTTFFLSMLSIIGTFKAFSHIYVLRGQATGKSIDTMSVHIFNTLYSANDPGYAASLAFTLFGVILILTLVQTRLAREQVFYG